MRELKRTADINVYTKSNDRYFAWTAYILFFLPVIFSKSALCTCHMRNAMKLHLMDLVGAGMLAIGILFRNTGSSILLIFIALALLGGVILIASLITKMYLIFYSIQGQSVSLPLR